MTKIHMVKYIIYHCWSTTVYNRLSKSLSCSFSANPQKTDGRTETHAHLYSRESRLKQANLGGVIVGF